MIGLAPMLARLMKVHLDLISCASEGTHTQSKLQPDREDGYLQSDQSLFSATPSTDGKH